ncbi:MAG: hypothetical protein ABSE73_09125 [Planctomycetota bacterium]
MNNPSQRYGHVPLCAALYFRPVPRRWRGGSAGLNSSGEFNPQLETRNSKSPQHSFAKGFIPSGTYARVRRQSLINRWYYNVGQKAPVPASLVHVPARMVPVLARLVPVLASLASVRANSEQFAQKFKDLHEWQRKKKAQLKGSICFSLLPK